MSNLMKIQNWSGNTEMNYWPKVGWRFCKSNVVKLHYMNFIYTHIYDF
jgi:hypothetical protein